MAQTTTYDPATATVDTPIPQAALDAHYWRFLFHDNPDKAAVWEHYNARCTAAAAPVIEAAIRYLDATDAARTDVYKQRMALHWNNRPAPKGRNMWGTVNTSTSCGGGLRFVSCSGHGGFLVSPLRESLIPAPLRKGMAYEEDDEWAIIGAVFPEAAVKMSPSFFCAQEDGTSARNYARRYAVEKLARTYGPTLRQILEDAGQQIPAPA